MYIFLKKYSPKLLTGWKATKSAGLFTGTAIWGFSDLVRKLDSSITETSIEECTPYRFALKHTHTHTHTHTHKTIYYMASCIIQLGDTCLSYFLKKIWQACKNSQASYTTFCAITSMYLEWLCILCLSNPEDWDNFLPSPFLSSVVNTS